MESLRIFVRYEIWVLILGLIFVVGYQLLTGRINTKKLLQNKTTDRPSPGRVQLLMLTLVGALYYLLRTADDPQKLPEIPNEWMRLKKE